MTKLETIAVVNVAREMVIINKSDLTDDHILWADRDKPRTPPASDLEARALAVGLTYDKRKKPATMLAEIEAAELAALSVTNQD